MAVYQKVEIRRDERPGLWLSKVMDLAVKAKEDARSFIQDWVPGSNAEDDVATAEITARKSADPNAKPPSREACCG